MTIHEQVDAMAAAAAQYLRLDDHAHVDARTHSVIAEPWIDIKLDNNGARILVIGMPDENEIRIHWTLSVTDDWHQVEG